jgi:hypothetical protein
MEPGPEALVGCMRWLGGSRRVGGKVPFVLKNSDELAERVMDVEPPDTQGSSVGPYSMAIRHRCPGAAFRGEADLHHHSLRRAEGRDPAKIHRDGCETAT